MVPRYIFPSVLRSSTTHQSDRRGGRGLSGDEDYQLLAQRNVRTDGLIRKPGKTFFWKGEYGDSLNEAITHTTELNVFAQFDPEIPESYRDSEDHFPGEHPSRTPAQSD
ncbi:MAG: hypothetical protein MZW92_71965 [Comamonadaceae bacterium]|nr:hypothetical protein [Comamonadaceae bacterium]